MVQTARLFMNGRSQPVRLPANCRFSIKEVYIHRDPESNDVILSHKPPNWDGFLLTLQNTQVPADFLNQDERVQDFQARGPFEGWEE